MAYVASRVALHIALAYLKAPISMELSEISSF
jgi:hypothetical protein